MKKTMKEEYQLISVRPGTINSKNSQPLSLTEQRVLFYSIFKIQNDKNSVTFTRQELNDIYDVDFGSFKDINRCLLKLRTFGMDTVDEKTQKIVIINAFSKLTYLDGVFTFTFGNDFLPNIEKQKDRFLKYGFSSIRQFKCKYTMYLYEFLKDSMWGNINKKEHIPIHVFRDLFKLPEDLYAKNSANFKKRVWGPAMDEINNLTFYQIKIVEKGVGTRKTFSIFRYENENFTELFKLNNSVKNNCHLGKTIIDETCVHCNRINICTNQIDTLPLDAKYSIYANESGWYDYIIDVYYANPQYDLLQRIQNKVASPIEINFYNKFKDIANNTNIALNMQPSTDEEIFKRLRGEHAKRKLNPAFIDVDNIDEQDE